MLNSYPDVLTVKQVAAILGIGKNAAYALIKQRAIGCRRVGRSIRIPKICLLDYLNSARCAVQSDNSGHLSERSIV